ncbi:MAG: hypothetical protein ACYDGW_01800 [Vulcanimicrobiaceae bacterium]
MQGDRTAIARLAQRVAGFHITDRRLLAAQRTIESALAEGSLDEATVASYARAVATYFSGFEREARAQLGDVDRRLSRVQQVAFNLAAERTVVAKRIEATGAVLDELRTLGAPS